MARIKWKISEYPKIIIDEKQMTINEAIERQQKMKTKEEFWSEVREISNTRSLNETERRNLLYGLDLLWKSGYYSKEP